MLLLMLLCWLVGSCLQQLLLLLLCWLVGSCLQQQLLLLLLCFDAAAAADAGCTLLLCQLQQVVVILDEHAAASCDEHSRVLA